MRRLNADTAYGKSCAISVMDNADCVCTERYMEVFLPSIQHPAYLPRTATLRCGGVWEPRISCVMLLLEGFVERPSFLLRRRERSELLDGVRGWETSGLDLTCVKKVINPC
jgi:hypothetical protein